MGYWEIFLVFYAPTVLAALWFTWRERRLKGDKASESPLAMVGLLLCAVWPLVAVAIIGVLNLKKLTQSWRATNSRST